MRKLLAAAIIMLMISCAPQSDVYQRHVNIIAIGISYESFPEYILKGIHNDAIKTTEAAQESGREIRLYSLRISVPR